MRRDVVAKGKFAQPRHVEQIEKLRLRLRHFVVVQPDFVRNVEFVIADARGEMQQTQAQIQRLAAFRVRQIGGVFKHKRFFERHRAAVERITQMRRFRRVVIKTIGEMKGFDLVARQKNHRIAPFVKSGKKVAELSRPFNPFTF